MKFLLRFLSGNKGEAKAPVGLADFLLHAPAHEKKEVFTKAAEKANEDQRATFERASLAQTVR